MRQACPSDFLTARLPCFRGFRELGEYSLGEGLGQGMLFRRPLSIIGQIDLQLSSKAGQPVTW